MKTNLLLLDSYVNIDNLLSVAFTFSKQINANLKIIYVFDFEWMRQSYMVGTGGPVDPALVAVESNARKEYEVAEKKIKEKIEEYKKKNEIDIRHEVYVSELNRIDIINEELKKNNDVLLMMSTHQSYTEASGGLVGYPDLLSHVNCPILALPDDTKVLNRDNILYATNYNPKDIPSLKHLHNMLNSSAKISVIHVTHHTEFDDQLRWLGFCELVKKEVGNQNLEFSLEKNENVEDGLQQYISNTNPDILAVLKEKRGFFKQIFTSGETKHILSKFNKPVLIYHE